eukprot:CAMPEP_0197552496 /NCGR_PEP_ID=MMETSP1320-20131121/5950_1 /TAXON_ID=91990 /ORGANISM="Bolidomonas sp., Strain RCC2347" /LENGTH=54 /DNA_ID=CAMNT_0043113077 /DNA_START=82 /DNA_END=243 /DNA_ORIENTATION=+
MAKKKNRSKSKSKVPSSARPAGVASGGAGTSDDAGPLPAALVAQQDQEGDGKAS